MSIAEILAARGLRAFRVPANPFICFDDPPADPPGNNPPPQLPPAALTPPTPPRAANQAAEDRVAQLEEINANLRVEAAQRRITERDARDRLTANETEMQRLRTESAAREAAAREAGTSTANKVKQRAMDAELKAAAVSAGLRDPDLLPLIDRAGVTIDDDGNVAGVEAAVTAFKAKKPEYFQAAAPARQPERVDVRSGNPAPPPPGPGAQPPAGKSVADIPRTREGKAEYGAAKKAALASLRG
jgi:hypothetical protein